MAVLTGISIPEIWNINDFESLRTFLVDLKLFVEELSRKAQSSQDNVMSTPPTADDFENDFQTIPYDDGTNRRIYYLFKGVPRYIALT